MQKAEAINGKKLNSPNPEATFLHLSSLSITIKLKQGRVGIYTIQTQTEIMANSRGLLVFAFFIALSFSAQGAAATARGLLQAATTTNPPLFPNIPPFRGFPFPPFNGPYPEYRLPPIFPGINSNVPPSGTGSPGTFPSFPAPPTFPNTNP